MLATGSSRAGMRVWLGWPGLAGGAKSWGATGSARSNWPYPPWAHALRAESLLAFAVFVPEEAAHVS